MIVDISEAKVHFERLVDMVCKGKEITIAKHNLPLVDLVIHKKTGKRKLGLLKGKFNVPDDFFDEDDAVDNMFYGES